MRRKKHKHTRRTVAFYRLSYGFHEPFKVLLDGNFIFATHSANLADLQSHLTRLLGGRVRLYVTRCVTRELEAMGEEMKEALTAARSYELHKCGHEAGESSAADCIKQQIGVENDDHWWVATQDRGLRSHLEAVPACPLIFATVNGIHLQEPPSLAKSVAHQEEEMQQVLPAHERTSQALKDLDELKRQQNKGRSKFRRNKAKGPNPLSVKKKQTKAVGAPKSGSPAPAKSKEHAQHAGANMDSLKAAGNSTQDNGAVKKRKRKRKKGTGSAGGEAAE